MRIHHETVDATFKLIGRLFLTMLAMFERHEVLLRHRQNRGPQNLGLIMSLFINWAYQVRKGTSNLLRTSARCGISPKSSKRFWRPHAFDNQVLAYANKYNITLHGPYRLQEAIEALNPNVDLPEVPPPDTDFDALKQLDPFSFTATLRLYRVNHSGVTAWVAGVRNTLIDIGGDNLDITTWMSEKRKSHHFDGKDPISKKQFQALLNGEVLGVSSFRAGGQESEDEDGEYDKTGRRIIMTRSRAKKKASTQE